MTERCRMKEREQDREKEKRKRWRSREKERSTELERKKKKRARERDDICNVHGQWESEPLRLADEVISNLWNSRLRKHLEDSHYWGPSRTPPVCLRKMWNIPPAGSEWESAYSSCPWKTSPCPWAHQTVPGFHWTAASAIEAWKRCGEQPRIKKKKK